MVLEASSERACPLESCYQHANSMLLGSPVRVKASVFLLSVSLAVSAVHAVAQVPAKPVDTTQLVAWLTGGVSSARLVRLVQERGLANLPTHTELRQVESAGAGKDLIRILNLGKMQSAQIGPAIPPALLRANTLARQQHYHEAELELREAVHGDNQNPALHFALGVMLRQQEQWDDAFDEVSLAARLMPELPENHSALAYLFYRLDDGPNAIAEARTALSIDPKNAEAYQYLGLGLYSNGQYGAAVHAYAEVAGPRSRQRRHVLRHGHRAARGREPDRRNRGLWTSHPPAAGFLGGALEPGADPARTRQPRQSGERNIARPSGLRLRKRRSATIWATPTAIRETSTRRLRS